MSRTYLYSMVLASIIIGIVGWSLIIPAQGNDRLDEDRGAGVLMVRSFRWTEGGNSARMEVWELRNNSAFTHYLTFDGDDFSRISTEEIPGDPDLSGIRNQAHYHSDCISYVQIYYERDPGAGVDPGLHFAVRGEDGPVDITSELREAILI